MPGCNHDATVLRGSAFWEQATGGHILSGYELPVVGCGPHAGVTKRIPLLVLGDAAYPMMRWLCKGFTNLVLSPMQMYYNTLLSSVRMAVECTFGRLKKRFAILCKPDALSGTDYPHICDTVLACCVMYNICEMHNNARWEEWAAWTGQDWYVARDAHYADVEARFGIHLRMRDMGASPGQDVHDDDGMPSARDGVEIRDHMMHTLWALKKVA